MGKRTLTRLAAAAAGGALALAVAAPALADESRTVDISNGDILPTTAADFEKQDCTKEIFAEKPKHKDGWHFVVKPFDGDKHDVQWSLKFKDRDGDTVTITNADANDVKHELRKKDDAVKLWLLLPAGWTLLETSKVVVPKDDTADTKFKLRHTCPGEVPEPPDNDEDVKKIIKKIVIEGDVHIDKSVNIDVHIEKIIIELKKKGVDFDHDDLKKIIKKIIEDERKKDDDKKDDKKDAVKDNDVKDDDKKLADTGSPVVGMAAMGGLLLAVGAAAMLGIRRRRLHFVDADE